MKHTPGPWHVFEATHCDGEFWCSIGYGDGRGPITDIVGAEGNKARYYTPVAGMKFLITPVEEQKANARLIAAAPELLLMAYDSLDFITGLSDYEVPLMLRERLQQAIAKAEGLDLKPTRPSQPHTPPAGQRMREESTDER